MWLMYLKGLRNTLFISIGACLLGLLIGIVVTCIRIAPKNHPIVKVLDKICGVYVTVIRGTPVVLQLFICYFVLLIGIRSEHHGANVHGCIIGNDVIVGMGAIVMDNTVVPDGTIIAAGAVVPANQRLEPGIWAGIPAKKIKDGSEAIREKAHANADHYLMYKKWYE